MFNAKKSMALGLFGLVAAAGATVLTVSTWPTSAPGQSSRHGSSGSGAGLAQQAAKPAERPGPYIVVYKEAALAAYDGSIAGLPAPPSLAARRPTKGADRIDVRSAKARAYVAHLEKRQRLHENTIAATLGRTLKVHRRMQHATNADIIELTAGEAARVAKLSDVALVEGYREYRLDSDAGPALIGAEPVWKGNPGNSLVAAKGEGVVVGVIDTGINFGSPSFTAVDPVDGYQHANPLGAGNYLGTCQPGGPDAGRCNDKLIGGYDFVCNLPASVGEGATFCNATGYFREEPGFGDTNSHGSHVAATAAGNHRDALYKGGTRRLSGVAPRANIVAFDVCYTHLASGGGSCPNTATLAAVDQAVADGVVDVINFSISGGTSPWGDATSLAFLNAVDAGIYVAVAGGNSGPGPYTVAHLEPWTATTAASQHGRGAFQPLFQVTGPGVVPEALTAILMLEGSDGVAQTAALSGPLKVSPGIDTATDGCAGYPANTFQGAIAVIRRGTCNFVDKVNFARDAGAIATILANNQATAVTPSVPGATIPVFSVAQTDGDAIRDWAATNPASTGLIGFPAAAIPNVADALGVFSSRGPAATLDLVKPDITAPGVDILATISGAALTGSENAVGLMSGTSMASPHHAGAAALLRQLRPTWTVPEIKSALEMTAKQEIFLEDEVTTADAFARGGGRVQVDLAARAGLVLHETKARFMAAGQGGGDLAALNLPSMARGKCIDQCVFTRTFRNTLAFSQTWSASVQGLKGTVSPAQFTIKRGERRTVTITIDTSELPPDGVRKFGTLALQPGSSLTKNLPVLRMPVAVAYPPPVLKLTPESVSLNVAAGSNEKVTFTVGNVGGALLGFSVDNTGTSVATVMDAKAYLAAGYRSGSYTDGPGEYVADDFTVSVPTRLTSLLAEGYLANSTPLTNVTWSIYPDSAGKPAGNPETAAGAAVWTYSASSSQPGVDTTNGNISLDLEQVGQIVTLAPGRYWLVMHARTSFADRWLWWVSNTGNGFMTIKPSVGGWTSNNAWPGLAFRVRGEVGCGAPWFGAVTPTMGQLVHDTSTGVQVQLGTSALAVGSHTGYLCLTSNDPARPKVAGRIGVTVRP